VNITQGTSNLFDEIKETTEERVRKNYNKTSTNTA
jgi:hypothetical protein